MRPNDENRAALMRVKLLAGLGERERDDLLHALRERRLATGEVLFRQGFAGDSLVITITGALSVRFARPDGTEVEVQHLGAGEVTGEMACIDPAPRSASVVATSETVVYELSRDALDALRRASPKAAFALVGAVIRQVTRRLRQIDERIEGHLTAQRAAGVPSAAAATSAAGAPRSVRPASRSVLPPPLSSGPPRSSAPPSAAVRAASGSVPPRSVRSAITELPAEQEAPPTLRSGLRGLVDRLRGVG